VVDIAVAWSFAEFVGLPLILSATAGFFCGAVINYFLHELWTFQSGDRVISLARMGRYAAGLAVVLIVRLATVVGLERLFLQGSMTLVILLSATVLSFAFTYVLSLNFVFTQDTSGIDKS
jgi:putative flippase GtrA